jgi:hypothetical protein
METGAWRSVSPLPSSRTSKFIITPNSENGIVLSQSIERAFDLRRPVSLLTEDSIRLFEGKEVRPLVGWDSDSLFSFDQKFLTKLKMWKKSGCTGRTTKVKATKRGHSSLEKPRDLSDEDDDDYAEGIVCDIEAV